MMIKNLNPLTMNNKNVHNPDHYNHLPNGIECIDVTEHFDFLVGNAIKYLWRAGKKDKDKEVEDLEKAIWYIKKKIASIQSVNKTNTDSHEETFNEKANPGILKY